MLGKLLKQEIKATGRTFMPIYAALLVLTVFNKLVMVIGLPDLFSSESVSHPVAEVIFGISMILYVSIIVALSVMTLVVIVQRFYKNLFTDEGYLMFSLPVKTWELIVSKLLIAMFWSAISAIAVFLTILILSWGAFTWSEISQPFIQLSQELDTQLHLSMGLVIFESVIFMIVDIVVSILMIYAAIAIGQLFSQHRILASFGAFIVISVALQILFSIFMLLIPIFNLDANYLSLIDPADLIQWSLNGTTIINLLLSGLFFGGTHYIMKNKLNLE